MPSIMLDLETLSTRPNAYILAIGAIQFDAKSGRLGQAFYQLVDAKANLGSFHIDPATVRWWLAQTVEARSLICDPNLIGLPQALVLFEAFLRESGGDDCEVWGNGSDFDNVILRQAFLACGKDEPWKHWNNRCFRTLKNLYNPEKPAPASTEQLVAWGAVLPAGLPAAILTAHSALGDAISQARSVLSIYGHQL